MSYACLIGGTFDRGGGKPSKVIQQLAQGLVARLSREVKIQNGGTLHQLGQTMGHIHKYTAVLWFPNISNDEPRKYVVEIKKRHPTCILVVSKRNDDVRYNFAQLMQRALGQRAALLVEFHKAERITGRVLDPLGNCFQGWTAEPEIIGRVLAGRILELDGYTRRRSHRINAPQPRLPEDELAPFFQLVRGAADKFHELVPTTSEDRFLGNSSFRCQRGFPSVNIDGRIWVSRRNIDKRFIGPDGFVAVEPELNRHDYVLYHGEAKPSVDTPIHLRLYKVMEQMRFAIHGHVYVADAPTTREAIPCGAVEEADAIMSTVAHHNTASFAINLRGHGFIAMAASVGGLKQFLDRLKPRPAPEMV